MKTKLASVSVDLDTLPHYFRIHGLDEKDVSPSMASLVYPTAVDRFQSVFRAAQISATYFAIGADLENPLHAQVMSAAARAGMEVASHSYRHAYDLSRQSFADISNDLRMAHETLERGVGKAPVGFRAPGYTLSSDVLRAVQERGYLYDSSVFPAIPYYLAKALILGGMRVLGQTSSSVLDTPKVLLAPTHPYRAHPTEVYRKGPEGVLELPITTGRFHRFPFIGTFALTFPLPVVKALYLSSRNTTHFNFELHAIDLLDAHDGLPPTLISKQQDLRVSHEAKSERLSTLIRWLQHDFDVVPLAEAAQVFRENLNSQQ